MDLAKEWWRSDLATDIFEALLDREKELHSYYSSRFPSRLLDMPAPPTRLKAANDRGSLLRFLHWCCETGFPSEERRKTFDPLTIHCAVYFLDLALCRWEPRLPPGSNRPRAFRIAGAIGVVSQDSFLLVLACLRLAVKYEDVEQSIPRMETMMAVLCRWFAKMKTDYERRDMEPPEQLDLKPHPRSIKTRIRRLVAFENFVIEDVLKWRLHHNSSPIFSPFMLQSALDKSDFVEQDHDPPEVLTPCMGGPEGALDGLVHNTPKHFILPDCSTESMESLRHLYSPPLDPPYHHVDYQFLFLALTNVTDRLLLVSLKDPGVCRKFRSSVVAASAVVLGRFLLKLQPYFKLLQDSERFPPLEVLRCGEGMMRLALLDQGQNPSVWRQLPAVGKTSNEDFKLALASCVGITGGPYIDLQALPAKRAADSVDGPAPWKTRKVQVPSTGGNRIPGAAQGAPSHATTKLVPPLRSDILPVIASVGNTSNVSYGVTYSFPHAQYRPLPPPVFARPPPNPNTHDMHTQTAQSLAQLPQDIMHPAEVFEYYQSRPLPPLGPPTTGPFCLGTAPPPYYGMQQSTAVYNNAQASLPFGGRPPQVFGYTATMYGVGSGQGIGSHPQLGYTHQVAMQHSNQYGNQELRMPPLRLQVPQQPGGQAPGHAQLPHGALRNVYQGFPVQHVYQTGPVPHGAPGSHLSSSNPGIGGAPWGQNPGPDRLHPDRFFLDSD